MGRCSHRQTSRASLPVHGGCDDNTLSFVAGALESCPYPTDEVAPAFIASNLSLSLCGIRLPKIGIKSREGKRKCERARDDRKQDGFSGTFFLVSRCVASIQNRVRDPIRHSALSE
uniref:Uncharacterized protein n=1 Tax=Anopheles coluzzii TaxID=1518534 RepID=A0A8W7PW74_ANOCL